MQLRPALGSALILLVAVHIVAVAPMATADSSITIKLSRVNGVTSTEQGTAFSFKVTATNSGATEKVSIFVQLTSPSSATEDIRSWTPTVPGGGSVSRGMSEVSSQWFEETGSFGLVAKVDGAVTGNTLTYSVTTATVTVPTFQDDTASLALDTVLPSDVNTSHSAGACWGDVNNDGHLDLFVPARDGPAQLWVFHPEAGTFQDEAAAWGVTNSGGKGVSCVFADYNNDGAEDLYVVNDAIDPITLLPTGQGNVLYRNEFAQGPAKFTDVSASAGVGTQGNGASASWGDYDGDGYLDLYTVTNNAYNIESHGPYITYYQQDHLFHNEGDGTFTDVTCQSLPENDPNSGFCPGNPAMGGSTGSGFQAVWIDYNLDGRVDLYLGQDDLKVLSHNDINRLYRNDGYDPQSGQWKFTDVCAEDPTRAECLKIHSMGIAVGDFNNDLWPDLAISNTAGGGGNILLENDGDGTFSQVASSVGVDRPVQDATVNAITWGLGFQDFNNDGVQDLYVAAGALLPTFDQPNELFVNTPLHAFLDLSAPGHAADSGVGHGVAFADFDRDGLVDMYVVNVDGSVNGPSNPILYRNVTATARHWLEVKLVGTSSVRDGCGARVVLTNARGIAQARWVMCGSSLGGGDDTTLHFGGTGTGRFTLDIDWPSGGHQVVQRRGLDRVLTVTES